MIFETHKQELRALTCALEDVPFVLEKMLGRDSYMQAENVFTFNSVALVTFRGSYLFLENKMMERRTSIKFAILNETENSTEAK